MTLQKQLQNYALWLEARGLEQVSRLFSAEATISTEDSTTIEVVKSSHLFVLESTASQAEEELILKIVSALKLGNDYSLLRADSKDILQIPALVKSWKLEAQIYIFSETLSEVSTGKKFSEVLNNYNSLDAIGLRLFTTWSAKELMDDPAKKAPLWQALQAQL